MSHRNNQISEGFDPALTALRWYVEQGVSVALLDAPEDRTKFQPVAVQNIPAVAEKKISAPEQKIMMIAGEQALQMAESLAGQAQSLEELAVAIRNFDGLSIKKTASHMVFADGNPKAQTMVIGYAPGSDEDREGKAFTGQAGLLLDKMLGAISLSRLADDPAQAVYLTNILNWRPPGNRSPSENEVTLSLPFIFRHIALIRPKTLILCGAGPAKALLGQSATISKLRGSFYNFTLDGLGDIRTLVTYAPDYLLNTPIQKKAAWQDLLMLRDALTP